MRARAQHDALAALEGEGTHTAIEFAPADLDEVYDMVLDRLLLEDPHHYPTSARAFRALYELLRERRRKRLPLFDPRICAGVMDLIAPRYLR